MSMEDLFNHIDVLTAEDAQRFQSRRKEIVAEVTEYIAYVGRSGVDAAGLAERLLAQAEEVSGYDGDNISLEVPAAYTYTGRPLATTF